MLKHSVMHNKHQYRVRILLVMHMALALELGSMALDMALGFGNMDLGSMDPGNRVLELPQLELVGSMALALGNMVLELAVGSMALELEPGSMALDMALAMLVLVLGSMALVLGRMAQ